jgi:protein gp37
MAETTKIQWCDHTFNPWIGCTKVNEGCKNCYAERAVPTRTFHVRWGPDGARYRTKWDGPPRWNRAAIRDGERRKVFCASLADVFEDRAELVPWQSDLFRLIDRCVNLDWLLLTKRPENIRRMWPGGRRDHCWLGTSIANQRNLDEFAPRLLAARGLAPVLFLSIEPLLAPVDLSRFLSPEPLVDWAIVGGESGPHARPCAVEWVRDITRQCQAAGIAVFVKQLGSDPLHLEGGRRVTFLDKKGGDPSEWPADLRVRQWPGGEST